MKEKKNLEIGAEKKRDAKKHFCVTKTLLA